MVHVNSAYAYNNLDKQKRINQVYSVIYKNRKKGISVTGIMKELGIKERNQVAPRVSDLLKEGTVKEVGSVIERGRPCYLISIV